jgi:hypothetical protein
MAIIGGLMVGVLGLGRPISEAQAQEPGRPAAAKEVRVKAVLELYTSQGCSSCPPADALLQSYAKRSDIVALTLPVDYWDYLGWKDTLASAKFTARQKYYAKQRGDGRIYTPQVIVNGLTHVVGSSAREIDHAIDQMAQNFANGSIPIAIRVDKSMLVIEAGALPGGADHIKDATIWLAVVRGTAEVPVRSGENRGKTLKFYNVVRDLTPVGMWVGKPITVRLDRDTVKLPDTESAAVIIQNGKAGPIIGAAMLPKL